MQVNQTPWDALDAGDCIELPEWPHGVLLAQRLTGGPRPLLLLRLPGGRTVARPQPQTSTASRQTVDQIEALESLARFFRLTIVHEPDETMALMKRSTRTKRRRR